jgi:glycosyltransferase involved in cell wall biosynthesis
VIIVCPGGLEHGGGIGRQMGYFMQADPGGMRGLSYRVVDSRGAHFLGEAPGRKAMAAVNLGRAAFALLGARLSATPTVAHINITGRGSTYRKAALAGLARAIGLRYLLHVHDYDYADDYRRHGAAMQWVVRAMFGGAKTVLVLGGRDRALLADLLRIPQDRISVLHNAVPDPNPAPAPTTDGPPRLVFLGHLSARKGVPELLQALATPALAARGVTATLAGGGPVEEFRAMAAELGVTDRVTFAGWVDETRVRAICAAAEILVLPSHAEGLAMAMLEGLSHGLAVIATPVGAHPEVIEPEISGLFVEPGDAAGLAQAIARVIDDPDLRARLRAGARRRFLDSFDVRGYAEKLSALHAGLLADRGLVPGAGHEKPV